LFLFQSNKLKLGIQGNLAKLVAGLVFKMMAKTMEEGLLQITCIISGKKETKIKEIKTVVKKILKWEGSEVEDTVEVGEGPEVDLEVLEADSEAILDPAVDSNTNLEVEVEDKAKAKDMLDQVKVEDLVVVQEAVAVEKEVVAVIAAVTVVEEVVIILIWAVHQDILTKKDYPKNPCLDQLQNNKNTMR
jgi:hypothetical protein